MAVRAVSCQKASKHSNSLYGGHTDSGAKELHNSRKLTAPDSPASHVVSSRFTEINHDRSKPAY